LAELGRDKLTATAVRIISHFSARVANQDSPSLVYGVRFQCSTLCNFTINFRGRNSEEP